MGKLGANGSGMLIQWPPKTLSKTTSAPLVPHSMYSSLSHPKPLQIAPYPIIIFRVGEPFNCCSAEIEITNVNRADKLSFTMASNAAKGMLQVQRPKNIVDPNETMVVKFLVLSGFPEFGPDKIKLSTQAVPKSKNGHIRPEILGKPIVLTLRCHYEFAGRIKQITIVGAEAQALRDANAAKNGIGYGDNHGQQINHGENNEWGQNNDANNQWAQNNVGNNQWAQNNNGNDQWAQNNNANNDWVQNNVGNNQVAQNNDANNWEQNTDGNNQWAQNNNANDWAQNNNGNSQWAQNNSANNQWAQNNSANNDWAQNNNGNNQWAQNNNADNWEQNTDGNNQWAQNNNADNNWEQNTDGNNQWAQNNNADNNWEQNTDGNNQWAQNNGTTWAQSNGNNNWAQNNNGNDQWAAEIDNNAAPDQARSKADGGENWETEAAADGPCADVTAHVPHYEQVDVGTPIGSEAAHSIRQIRGYSDADSAYGSHANNYVFPFSFIKDIVYILSLAFFFGFILGKSGN